MARTEISNVNKERTEFSRRLQHALEQANYQPDSPTRLAELYNTSTKTGAVTVHAARKWLVGEAIPTQDKVVLLAQLTGVTPEWLRFGTTEMPALPPRFSTINPKDARLLSSIRALNPDNQEIIVRMVRALQRAA